MIATADSRINSKICAEINNITREVERVGPVPHNKDSSRWPAQMLAARRTASVHGRKMFLIVSISTIKGIRANGVPCGTKCANMCFVCLIHPNSISVTHKGRDKDKVIAICLDLVNTYGRSPKKLLNTIREKIDLS